MGTESLDRSFDASNSRRMSRSPSLPGLFPPLPASTLETGWRNTDRGLLRVAHQFRPARQQKPADRPHFIDVAAFFEA